MRGEKSGENGGKYCMDTQGLEAGKTLQHVLAFSPSIA
jgi:hypothetical protein